MAKRSVYIEHSDHVFDKCGYIDDQYQICWKCFLVLKKNQYFKYDLWNKINVILCQHYFAKLSNLIVTTKVLIVKYHSINMILKLCRYDFNNYRGLKSHMIVLFQNSIVLLKILSFLILELNDVIKVAWIDSKKPTTKNLKKIWKYGNNEFWTL